MVTDANCPDSGVLPATRGRPERKCRVDWCGAFVAFSMLRGGMNTNLFQAFSHVDNVEALFTYGKSGVGYGTRIPDRIVENGRTVTMEAHQRALGEPRTWISKDDVRKWNTVETVSGRQVRHTAGFRPGDVVVIDHTADGKPDHIAIVRSWNETT